MATPRPAAARVGRGLVSVLAGVVGLVVGVGVGVLHLTHGLIDFEAVAAIVALGAGCLLLVSGTAAVARSMHRWARLLLLPAGLAIAIFVGWPVTQALYATNVPRPTIGASTPAASGLPYAEVEFQTTDGIMLSGWYIPSQNGAAVVLMHGASSTRSNVLAQAVTIARNGYGVLLFDARGHGRSGGRAMEFGWYGDLDIQAAVTYVEGRPDIDPDRIAAVGMSMGGEEAIGAAAADPRIQAVVAEGATGRVYADKGWLPTHWRGWIQRVIDATVYGTADLLSDASPPISLREAVRQSAPRPVLLIAGGAVMGHAEEDADRWIEAGSPDTVEVWVVPGAHHIGAMGVAPEQWEARVITFLERALLDDVGQE